MRTPPTQLAGHPVVAHRVLAQLQHQEVGEAGQAGRPGGARRRVSGSALEDIIYSGVSLSNFALK